MKMIPTFLKEIPFLKDLNSDQFYYLMSISEELKLNPGDYVIHEGELSKEIYIVLAGIFEVTKKNPSGETVVIGEIGEEKVFGELSLIDAKPRSSSVRSKSVGVVLKIPDFSLQPRKKGFLSFFSRSLRDSTYDILYQNIIKESFNRFRSTNQKFVDAVKEQINLNKIQNDFGAFFVYITTLISTYVLLFYYFSDAKYFQNSLQMVISSCFLLLTTLFFLFNRGIRAQQLGLTSKNLVRSFLESVGIVFLAFVSLGAVYAYSAGSWIPFLEIVSQRVGIILQASSFALLFYIFTIEFVLRGVILGSLQRFLNDTRGVVSVVLTSFYMLSLNLQEGLDVLIIKLYIDLAMGFIYLRQKNLVGVTLLHFLIVKLLDFHS